MIDLCADDPDSTLGDHLLRMPKERLIAIGIKSGYVYEGSAGGFFEAERSIKAKHLAENRRLCGKHLGKLCRAAAKGSDIKALKEKVLSHLDYAENYVNLRDRHLVRAYTRGANDEIVTMIVEGEEAGADPA